MKKMSFFIAIIFLFTSCKEEINPALKTEVVHLPYFNSADFTPEWKKGNHRIPNFSFINQKGDTITNKTYEDKIYIANFFFTVCPGICPKLTKGMQNLQKTYANDNDVMLLSHSVMPWHDSVDVLAEYATNHHIKSEKWNLITGNKDSIYTIARKGYFADEDFIKTQSEDDFIHTENFILIDKKGYIRGVYNGTIQIELQRLERHIKILKKEA